MTDSDSSSDENAVVEARNWVESVVVGFNFCPFARRELQRDSIRYRVIRDAGTEDCLHALIAECVHLDEHPETETTLLIYPPLTTSTTSWILLPSPGRC